ncbi:MAG: hypothetical protein OJF49_004134 [Ktedonobacterales bacterium]|nr:MAG: hypothetical protein OJF49_004134 [Ktedonobacterales bacterium]
MGRAVETAPGWRAATKPACAGLTASAQPVSYHRSMGAICPQAFVNIL